MPSTSTAIVLCANPLPLGSVLAAPHFVAASGEGDPEAGEFVCEFVGEFVGGPIDGAALDTARTLAPRIEGGGDSRRVPTARAAGLTEVPVQRALPRPVANLL
jgi:hypothetical protein